jgi:hypothetical protein
MLVTLLGMVMLVSPPQLANALLIILVTLEGITTLVTLLAPKKTLVFDNLFPTCLTAYPPNTLGIVTAPVAEVEMILAPPFSIM